MAAMVTMMELEAGINRLLRAQPVVAGELAAAVRVLAELYGQMIYRRQALLALAELTPELRAALGAAGVAEQEALVLEAPAVGGDGAPPLGARPKAGQGALDIIKKMVSSKTTAG